MLKERHPSAILSGHSRKRLWVTSGSRRETNVIEPRNAADLPYDVRGKSLLFLLVNDEGCRRLLLVVQGETYN